MLFGLAKCQQSDSDTLPDTGQTQTEQQPDWQALLSGESTGESKTTELCDAAKLAMIASEFDSSDAPEKNNINLKYQRCSQTTCQS